jgi:hypothetical protein
MRDDHRRGGQKERETPLYESQAHVEEVERAIGLR